MAATDYKVFWFTFNDGWNSDGTPIIKTQPSKGLNIRDAERWLKQGYPRAAMVGQATQEDITKYKDLKSQSVRSKKEAI